MLWVEFFQCKSLFDIAIIINLSIKINQSIIHLIIHSFNHSINSNILIHIYRAYQSRSDLLESRSLVQHWQQAVVSHRLQLHHHCWLWRKRGSLTMQKQILQQVPKGFHFEFLHPPRVFPIVKRAGAEIAQFHNPVCCACSQFAWIIPFALVFTLMLLLMMILLLI